MSIVIKREHIFLRDHIDSDLNDFHSWISNSDVMEHLIWKTTSLEESRERLNESILAACSPNRNKYYFAIIRKSDSQYIGDCGFEVSEESIAEIGYFLKPEFHGMGLASSAVRGLIDFCFGVLNLNRVIATCSVENIRSELLMKRVGMQKDLHYNSTYFHKGREIKRVLYYINNDFLKK